MEQNVIDWSTAEAMAFGSLLSGGYNIRISGQGKLNIYFNFVHFLRCWQGNIFSTPRNACR